ncbi:hypothetical protein B0A49_00982 [Cryomyces minteri]|uniref:Uncharacterized protein n=1 Tax=Cryomyces minteri TaxID=331657 RepID=A0A4U0XP99_9PEZI|nr:hypothetical protein B0A49_00982 [Cryomyces minteri]
MSFFKQVANTAPLDYISPPFPSLYWPFPVQGYQANYLYYARDICVGGIEAVIAGSVVGGLLGGVYSSGFFRMSTWIPLVWALINALVLILSSFAIQGGL